MSESAARAAGHLEAGLLCGVAAITILGMTLVAASFWGIVIYAVWRSAFP